MEMLGGNQKYRIDLVELFGEENLAESILEEYIEINEAALLIAFGENSWPAQGPQSFLTWKDPDTISSYLKPAPENITRHTTTLELLKTGLANRGRKLLARHYDRFDVEAVSANRANEVEKNLFVWIDPLDLGESGYFPTEDSRPVFLGWEAFDLVLVKKRDLEPFIKLFQNEASSSTEIPWSSSSEVSNRLGRPRQWDWDAIFCQIVLIANTINGLPETQSKLIQEVMDFCVQIYGDCPSVSQIKKKTKPIYDALKSRAHNSK